MKIGIKFKCAIEWNIPSLVLKVYHFMIPGIEHSGKENILETVKYSCLAEIGGRGVNKGLRDKSIECF